MNELNGGLCSTVSLLPPFPPSFCFRCPAMLVTQFEHSHAKIWSLKCFPTPSLLSRFRNFHFWPHGLDTGTLKTWLCIWVHVNINAFCVQAWDSCLSFANVPNIPKYLYVQIPQNFLKKSPIWNTSVPSISDREAWPALALHLLQQRPMGA